MMTRSITVVMLIAFIISSCAPIKTASPTETTANSTLIPPTPFTAISVDPIAGKWMGSFQGISDDFSAQIHITIDKNCETNNICGTYSVPSLPCSGSLILNGTDNTTFVFVEQRTGGADWCGSGGFEYMELQPNNTLSWGYSDPNESIKSKGILSRVARDGDTAQVSTAIISKDNISKLTELAIWGKGVIKAINWSEDGKQIFVDTSINRYIYDSTTFQLIEEVSSTSSNSSMLTFDVEDLGSTTDNQGRLKHQFRVHVFNEGRSPVGSFDIENIYQPQVKYLPESNMISIDNMMGGLGLHDGTNYDVICSISGSRESPVTVTKDRKTVATGTMDGYIIVKNGDGFVNEFRFEAGGPVHFLSFSPDATKLMAETNGNIFIWDVASAAVSASLSDTFLSGNFFYDQYHSGTDATVGLTVKDNRIAYVNKNIVIIRSLLDGKQSGLIDGRESTQLDKEYKYEGGYLEIDAVFFTGDNQSLITVNFDRAYEWDLSTNQFVKMFSQEQANGVFAGLVSTYSAAQNLLLTGSQTGTSIKSWNVENGVQGESIHAWNIGNLKNSYDGTHSLTISPDGRYVFSWSGLEGVANLWEVETQTRAMSIKIPRSEYSQYQPGFYPVAISPDNSKLVFSYSLQPELHLTTVYSVPDGTELYQIENYHAAFSPDGTMIAASVGNNQIRFYDSQTGEAFGDVTSKSPNPGSFQLLYFSEDGKSLIAVSTKGTISIWGIP